MDTFIEILPALGRGALITIMLTLVSGVGALIIAFAAGIARLSSRLWITLPIRVYVEIFRTTSSLVQIFYFFFVLPLLGIRLEPFETGCLVLSLNFGAYLSEIVRSSILAVHRGQYDASVALSMSIVHRYRRIILPQAIPMMLPAFGNYALELLKATSLVSLITISELTFTGSQLVQYYGQPTLVYFSIFLIYLVLALPIVYMNRRIEQKVAQGWRKAVKS